VTSKQLSRGDRRSPNGQATIEYAAALVIVLFMSIAFILLFDENLYQTSSSSQIKRNALEVMYHRMEYNLTKPYP
jgi:hypothetical protein